jgi:hypothetical protein
MAWLLLAILRSPKAFPHDKLRSCGKTKARRHYAQPVRHGETTRQALDTMRRQEVGSEAVSWHDNKLHFPYIHASFGLLCVQHKHKQPHWDVRFAYTASDQQLEEKNVLVDRATTENCDSHPAGHLDATGAPRSLGGEEELRLRTCRHQTPEQTPQAMKDVNLALLPFEPARRHETLDKDVASNQSEE